MPVFIQRVTEVKEGRRISSASMDIHLTRNACDCRREDCKR